MDLFGEYHILVVNTEFGDFFGQVSLKDFVLKGPDDLLRVFPRKPPLPGEWGIGECPNVRWPKCALKFPKGSPKRRGQLLSFSRGI